MVELASGGRTLRDINDSGPSGRSRHNGQWGPWYTQVCPGMVRSRRDESRTFRKVQAEPQGLQTVRLSWGRG